MATWVRSAVLIVGIVAAAWLVSRPGELSSSARAADAADPFVGDYAGSLTVTGIMRSEAVRPRTDCGACHASAQVSQDASGYALDFTLRNSPGKADAKARLTGQRDGDKVVFQGERCVLTAAEGKLTGEWKGGMRGTLKLGRSAGSTPPATSQPTSCPAK